MTLANLSSSSTTKTNGEKAPFLHVSPRREAPRPTSASGCNLASVQNSLTAGYVAGLTGTLVGYPMDSAKVWMQTKRQATSMLPPPQQSAIVTVGSNSTVRSGTRALSSWAAILPHEVSSSTTTTTTTSGRYKLQRAVQLTRALYRGVSGPLVTVGLVQSLNFAIYDSTRRVLYAASSPRHQSANGNDYLQDDSLLHVGVASVTAGAVLAFVTSPLIMIKTKQQVQQISFAQAARQTLGQGGSSWSLQAISRGFGPHFLTETAGRGIYFVAYESAKRTWATRVEERRPLSLMGRMVSAGAAGIFCSTVMFPLDVIRSRLYASPEYISAWTMSRRIYHEWGLRGFFRGYGISIFRAGPVAAMVLPIYDYTLEHLNHNQGL